MILCPLFRSERLIKPRPYKAMLKRCSGVSLPFSTKSQMRTITFYFCYFYEDLLSHCYQGLLSWKQITQLDTAVAFCGCFQRDQERKNKQTWHFRSFYICWYTERQKKTYSLQGTVFISFLNRIFLKSGMARRMLAFSKCFMPTQ